MQEQADREASCNTAKELITLDLKILLFLPFPILKEKIL
jgi:hypothetical protein